MQSEILPAAAEREVPACRFCGFEATCHGTYEGETGYACDTCCGHGCEDGWCERLAVEVERTE